MLVFQLERPLQVGGITGGDVMDVLGSACH